VTPVVLLCTNVLAVAVWNYSIRSAGVQRGKARGAQEKSGQRDQSRQGPLAKVKGPSMRRQVYPSKKKKHHAPTSRS